MSAVLVQRDEQVLRITLNRPEKLNAVTPDDIVSLHKAMDGASGVRAIVFSGTGGRAFNAGMHVDSFAAMNADIAETFIGGVRDLMRRVRTAPAICICAIDGYCLGFGFELALACDLRIATPRSSFGLPEIKVGVPSVIDAALLQQYVGLSLAKEMILTGDIYPLSAVRSSGICNAVVEPDDLPAATRRMLDRVTGHTSVVVASQKRLFETWQNTFLVDGIDVSVSEFATVLGAPETHEHLTRTKGGSRPPTDGSRDR